MFRNNLYWELVALTFTNYPSATFQSFQRSNWSEYIWPPRVHCLPKLKLHKSHMNRHLPGELFHDFGERFAIQKERALTSCGQSSGRVTQFSTTTMHTRSYVGLLQELIPNTI